MSGLEPESCYAALTIELHSATAFRAVSALFIVLLTHYQAIRSIIKRSFQQTVLLFNIRLEYIETGPDGFEPSHKGVKVPCLNRLATTLN